MEQNNPFEQTTVAHGTEKNLFDLQVDHETISYLGETARWAKFLAIIGFIGCGLAVIFGIFAGSIFGAMGTFGRYGLGGGGAILSVVIGIIYIAIALLYFFPCLYLFNFASRMQVALRNNDQVQLNSSLRNLKSCYKFLGILMIVVLAFYGLSLIGGIIGGAFR
jgi:hypothetical protein